MTKENSDDPFFSLLKNNSEWNACIGNQAHPENYVDGYMEAALEIVNAVIEKRQLIKRDTLAMPTLYNARHALELSLKCMHDAFLKEGLIRNAHSQNHDILSYWKLLSSVKLGDKELTQYIQNLEIYVVSLSNIDDDGQELRYATNKDGQKSLQDKSLCNLIVIRESLLKLQEILSKAKDRLEAFVYERGTSTYTDDCSRKDLDKISKILPPFDKWTEEIFDTAKQEVKKEYGIGSNKFSKAVDVMKNHRTMASCLGKEFDLLHLTDDKIKLVIQEWKKLHVPKNPDDLGTDFANIDFEAMKDHLEKTKTARETILNALSDDEIADLESVFYIGRDSTFCEFYEKKVSSVKKENQANQNIDQEINHLLEKTNFLDGLVNGLKTLGKPALAEEISAS